MKRFLPLIGLCAFVIFGVMLLFQMAAIPGSSFVEFKSGKGEIKSEGSSGKFAIRQSTRNAIIDVKDSDIADALYRGGIEIVCDHPGSKTLLRISTGEPPRILGVAKGISSNGEVFIVNPNGVIVGTTAAFDLGNFRNPDSTLDASQPSLIHFENNSPGKVIAPDAVELKAHGNVYALAINNGGMIRINGSGGRVQLIQTGKKKESVPLIRDEVK